MSLNFKFSLVIVLVLLVPLSGCKKGCTDMTATNYDEKAKRDDGSCLHGSFDKKEMLKSIGENVIIPAYTTIQLNVSNLEASVSSFTSNPDSSHLVDLRLAFKQTYLAWQAATPFEFGPAADVTLRSNLNTFPTDTTKIENNVSNGSYNLATASNLSTKGFPAIDYLINGDSITNVVALFSSSNRVNYLKDVTDDIESLVDGVTNEWSLSSGNYLNIFSNNDGVDVGSSLGLLVNELNRDFELIKNIKIGIPLGKKTLGTPFPGKTEAFYGSFSVELALSNVESIEASFKVENGLYDYLDFLGATHQNDLLSEKIKNQFADAKSALKLVSDPLSNAVINDSDQVNNAYDELQKLVVLLKVDMPSAVGTLITYQDNDGD